MLCRARSYIIETLGKGGCTLRMYLKQLELNGFKSFATHTELEFVPGVTAVVGPNGSGKSNVADAVRWVLGEQSARTLRGGKMEDVIFAGSDSRHAVNFCEVSLTLDNSDGELPLAYSEVTVTRRLYRSGESEYYLNRQLCRLKDITELFMDTGLGKEAYSIIGQGRIDEILSTKAEDRRGVFEEAAGIVKFKVRKREAERKLDETEQNLARLHDLIYELREQEGPLAEQAKKAKTYHSLREKLKQCEVGLFVHNITQIHREWEQSSEQLQALAQEKLTAETEMKQQEAVIEQQQWRLQQLDEQLETKQQKLLMTSEAVEKAEGQRDVLQERERNQHAERERFSEQVAHLQERLEHVNSDLSQVNERLQAKKAEVARISEELEKREQRLEKTTVSAEEQIEEVKSDLIELMGETASLKNDLRYLDEQEQRTQDRLQSLRKEKEDAELLSGQMREQLDALEAEQTAKSAELQTCLNDYQALVKKRETILATGSNQTEKMRELEQKLNNLCSRRDVLKEWEADFSGFFQGVKEVLRARERGKLQGIEGAVAELITVPRKWETAMETALGGALQHLVVKSEQHGRMAIDYLKKQRLGRATFLPLDVIQARTLPHKDQEVLEQDEGFVGIGVDLVQCDSRYHNIIASLLGNVVIAQKIVDANRIARLLRYRYRIVTLDGDIVNPGGSMSGGSTQKRGANLLGRKRELEDLEREIKAADREKAVLAQDIHNHVQEKDRVEQQLETMRSQGETLRLAEQKLAGQLEHKRSEYRNIADRLEQLGNDQDHLVAEAEQLKYKRHEIETRLAEKKETEQHLNEELQRLEQVIDEQKRAKETESVHVTELKVSLAKRVQEREHLWENRKRLENEATSLKEELHVLSERIMELEKRFANNNEEKLNVTQKIRELRHEKDQVQGQLEELRQLRTRQQNELNAFDAVHRQCRKALQVAETKCHQQEVKVNRLDVELNTLLTSLSEQYEMSYELARDRYDVPDDPHAAEVEVKQLKEQLTALGDVNLGAIEEHRRISVRLEFLDKQQQDLLEAKATLYDVIDNMDQEMSERFKTTFQAIREQFQTVFVELFGGGRADLQLTNPDSLLDTGIDIVAQPPGKKLQHLSLLSGGERTLTAIALLFAILRVRPVPFCILDEVEAALDETNVVRFARYLRVFSQRTQFIVITHRKGTMEEADVLYGVTMQESGVSKLVSVKLDGGAAQEIAASAE